MTLDWDGLTIFIGGAIGRTLAWDIGHHWLEVPWRILDYIGMRIQTLYKLFLVSSWTMMSLVRSTSARVTDGYDLVVSVTACCHLVLVDWVSLTASSTEDLIPLPLQVRIVIHAACWWDYSLCCCQSWTYVAQVDTVLSACSSCRIIDYEMVQQVFWHILKLFQSFIIYLK
jgi:hypothetical protein